MPGIPIRSGIPIRDVFINKVCGHRARVVPIREILWITGITIRETGEPVNE
jgi:hypothetical protein